jgi:prefoldin subunit 5
MSEEPLLDRLERLKAKQERGEELTDEEIEQLKADMQEFNDAMSSLFGNLMNAIRPAIRDMNNALQPLAEIELEVDDDA